MNSTPNLLESSRTRRGGRIWRWRRTPDEPEACDSTMPPRIVILSASVGAGHIRTAQAIQSALARLLPNATIAHVDVLKLTNGMFRRAYSAGYFQAVDRAPRLVGMMYDLLDKPGGGAGATGATRLAFER